ncbi:MAG: hypothetical protein C4292_01820 [Nitrososphaera sp.]
MEVVWHDSMEAGGKGGGGAAMEKERSPVDYFVAGALAATASQSTGSNWRFEEIECMATGSQCCRFRGSASNRAGGAAERQEK